MPNREGKPLKPSYPVEAVSAHYRSVGVVVRALQN